MAMAEFDYLLPLHEAAMDLGWLVAGIVNLFTEAATQMTADPKAFARDIALQLIMFVLTTVILGSMYHYWVLKPREEKEARERESRRAMLMGPFREMLIMRLSGTHAAVFKGLTQHETWNGNWGRPRIRSVAGAIATCYAELTGTVLGHSDLLQADEQEALGKYSKGLFDLQRQFERIEQGLRDLSIDDVKRLGEAIATTNEAVLRVGSAFEEFEQSKDVDLSWDEEDIDLIEANLIDPLLRRANAIANPPPKPPSPSAPRQQVPETILAT